MYRRQFLAVAACSAGLAGCLGGSDDAGEMDEGSPLLSVTVDEGFSGTVQIEGDCRDEVFEVPPSGDQFQIRREADGETCSFDLSVDGEHVQSVTSRESHYHRLEINRDGEIAVHDEVIQN